MEKFFDLEAECYLLGTLIGTKNNANCYELALESLQDNSFYDPRNRIIFASVRHLYSHGTPVDAVSVLDHIKSCNLLDTVTHEYWAKVVTSSSFSVYLKSYIDIVVKHHKRRQLSQILKQGLDMCADESFDLSSIVSHVENGAMDLSGSSRIKPYVSIQSVLSVEMEKLNQQRKNPSLFTGINSGYREIDAKTNGFSAGQMVVIAARAGIGKTSFAVDLAKNFCTQEKKSVGFISLEMPSKEIVFRFISSYAKINGRKLKKPWLLTKEELGKLGALADKLKDIKFFIQDRSGMTMSEIRNEAKKMKRQEKIDALFIDYLGLIKSDHSSSKSPRWEIMQDISAEIKILSKELEIPIFVLNQLNRDAEGKVPTLAHLRESGAVEQDADMVFILHRERKPEEGKRGILTTVKLEKNRNGESGDSDVLFIPEYASFVDIDPQYRD